MQNYFTVFNLPPAFDLDLAVLEKLYFEAQRKFHPDRITGKNAAERQQAIAQSMLANQAYETLKSPLKRAQHLLALQGISVGGEQDSIKPSHALLTEIMELRETLEEVKTTEELEKTEARNNRNKEDIIRQLSSAFSQKGWQQAAAHTIRLGYLVKLDDEIRIKKKGLG